MTQNNPNFTMPIDTRRGGPQVSPISTNLLANPAVKMPMPSRFYANRQRAPFEDIHRWIFSVRRFLQFHNLPGNHNQAIAIVLGLLDDAALDWYSRREQSGFQPRDVEDIFSELVSVFGIGSVLRQTTAADKLVSLR
jgi:hypothetical protein